jgi:DNA-binding NarL/FixJ family response regulator
MAATQAIQLMIVDDHPAFRMGLAALEGSQPDMVVVARLDVQDRTEAAISAIRHGIVHLE